MTNATVRERPILFSGPMVRAILDGTKTQTRRLVKPQPYESSCAGSPMIGHAKLGGEFAAHIFGACATALLPCPYGAPGDRLWVRETWYCDHYLVRRGGGFKEVEGAKDMLYYRATDCDSLGQCYTGFSGETMDVPWNSSIHMPRWASRITLDITDVRVERLQDVSEEDAVAEGIDFMRQHPDFDEKLTARDCFDVLWDHINAKRAPWESNPWVWVVSFARSGGDS